MKQLLILCSLILAFSFSLKGQCSFDPTITVSPFDPNYVYCPGDMVTLATEAYDSYQWFYNFSNSNTGGTPIMGATGQQYVVDVAFWGFAWFYVEATKDGCTEASPTQIIDSWVFLSPVIQSSGQSTYCEGDSTEILMPSPGIFKYRWYRNGVLIPGANQQNYWVKESGTYTIEVAYEPCPELWWSSGVGPSFTFLELETPNVTLSGNTLTADSGTQLQWFLNGQPINGANGPSWVATQTGSYTLLFTGSNGCSGVTPPVFVTISSVGEPGAAPVRIYPNPAREAFFIEAGADIARIQVIDMQGRVWQAIERPGGSEIRIPMENSPAGMYVVRVVLADGRQYGELLAKAAE
jgi:hypothetical protein